MTNFGNVIGLITGSRFTTFDPALPHLVSLVHFVCNDVVCVCMHIFDLGMYSFILEEHKETYSVFYKEITGKSLQEVSLLGSSSTTSGMKRKVQSASKEEPRIKKSKSEQKVSQKIIVQCVDTLRRKTTLVVLSFFD